MRRLIAAGICAMLAGAITLAAQGQEAKVHVKGYISPAVARAQNLGRLKPDERIRFSIALPVRNEPQLDALLKDLYTPGNPRFHHYLKKGEFGRLFGATEEDYAAVSNFVSAQGLEVVQTYNNRLLLDVAGRSDKIENAFGFHMMHLRGADGGLYHSPDDDPQVPASIAKRISGIVGLDSTRHMHRASCGQNSTGSFPGAGIGTGPNGGLSPSDIRNAYVGSAGATLTGNGQTIALVEFDGYNESDIETYECQFDLSTTPHNVLLNGYNGVPLTSGNQTQEQIYTEDQTEVTMDIELAIAMAPGAQIWVYEDNDYQWLPVFNKIASDDAAEQVSTSWADYEGDSGLDIHDENNTFKAMGAQGQSMFAASGDQGNQVPNPTGPPGSMVFGVNDPASQWYVTGVGGTALTTSGRGGAWQSEIVWNDTYQGVQDASGGGISTEWSLPYYQLQAGGGMGIVNPKNGATDPDDVGKTGRCVPDVALNADAYSFYAIYLGFGSYPGWTWGGGTSAAAPLWAAYCALVNQWGSENGYAPAGCINFDLYVVVSTNNSYYTANFHDIQSGNNETSANESLYKAYPGYDDCTGWGTPNGIGAILPPKALKLIRVPPRILKLEWNPDPVLQENSNLRTTNWVNVTNQPVFSNGVYSVSLPATNPAEFFRLNNSSPCVSAPSGLVHWWPANDSANDIIGSDNGILQGGVTYTNGEVGQAFNFDGSSGYVATSLVITNPQTFSLTLWFQTETTNGGVLISFDNDQYVQSGDEYDRNIYMDNTGALHFGVWNSGAQQISSGPNYNDGNWHYVVGSLSASTGLSLYIDGVLIGNNPSVTSAQEVYNGYWRIGQDNLDNWPSQFQPNSYFFQGQIDEVAIFDTALSAANAAAIFDAGSGGMCQP